MSSSTVVKSAQARNFASSPSGARPHHARARSLAAGNVGDSSSSVPCPPKRVKSHDSAQDYGSTLAHRYAHRGSL